MAWLKQPMSRREHAAVVLLFGCFILLFLLFVGLVYFINISGLLDGVDLFPNVDMIPRF